MTPVRVLHVIAQLRRGGPLQALIAAKKRSRFSDSIEHHIASLGRADRYAVEEAARAGIACTNAPAAAHLARLVVAADIVQVHFWNHPQIHAFLTDELPPARLLLWCHVNGAAPPHVIPARVVERCDMAVALTPATLDLPAFRAARPTRATHMHSLADFSRLAALSPVPNEGFCVGYVGTVDFVKLHPDYARLCASINVPSIRFLVCGDGSAAAELKRQARDLGAGDRFKFRDYVADIAPVLARFDVFGYPLAPGNYATAELALQEAMHAGIPPVVFADGGPGDLVQSGVTGLVVRTGADYVDAIEWLYRHPTERRRLGDNAARAMRDLVQRYGSQSDALYHEMMRHPKRARERMEADVAEGRGACSAGAWSLVRSLDGAGVAAFIASLSGRSERELELAEAGIAQSSADMQSVVLQYRLCHPDDPHLRLWAGMILSAKDRPALAAAEFSACIAHGGDWPRVHRYLRHSMEAARARAQAAGNDEAGSPRLSSDAD